MFDALNALTLPSIVQFAVALVVVVSAFRILAGRSRSIPAHPVQLIMGALGVLAAGHLEIVTRPLFYALGLYLLVALFDHLFMVESVPPKRLTD